jgi:hypothetical protein
MHVLWHTRNGIDGTSASAQIAADARRFVDPRDPLHARSPKFVGQRRGLPSEHRGEILYQFLATRRAAIDVGGASGDRLSVGTAAGIAALRALNAWQAMFDCRYNCPVICIESTRDEYQNRGQTDRNAGQNGNPGQH